MNPITEKSPYLLVFHRPAEQPPCSREVANEHFTKAMAWIDGLRTKGISKGGRPLENGGRVLRPKGAAPIDGPYAEGKEVVGGYLIILARDLDEACAIASTCPGLDNEVTVEVRPVMQVPAEYDAILS